jgi:hypothetical protein
MGWTKPAFGDRADCRFRRWSAVLLLVLLVLGACESAGDLPPKPVAAGTDPEDPELKVVIFAIDGPRYTETLGDPTHTYIPHIWNDLRPQGTILTNFRNLGQTKTVPGHTSILTGTWQDLANDGSERPDKPTLFEYYRDALAAPQAETWVISGKSKLDVCAYGTHADYGPALGATSSVGLASDLAVYNELMSVLQNDKPRLVLACLPGVDWAGHTGVWADYVDAIVGADSLAWKTWNYLQSDPFYAGQTYMFIVNDHGRHDDAHGGFRSHGDECEGCRHLTFVALGPNIKAGFSEGSIFTQRDVCPTVGEILAIPVPYAEGKYMQDLFDETPVGIKGTACSGRR